MWRASISNLASAALAGASALAGTGAGTGVTLTLVFVHGFLGSADSFCGLPGDMQRRLAAAGVRARVLTHSYASSGSNDARAAELAAWLRSGAGGGLGRGDAVVLLGHSMGGLLCVDAARALAGDGGAAFAVVRVVAFDSPFLGVHPRAVVHSGGAKAVDRLASIAGFLGASSGASSGSTTGVSLAAAPQQARATTSASTSTSSSSSTSFSWGSLATAGVAAATIAAAAYSSPTVRDSVSKAVSTHASFLGPLWSPGDQEARLRWILSNQDSIQFTCFYLVTTMMKNDNSSVTVMRNTFITTPPQNADYAHLFKPIEYDSTRNPKGAKECEDEIEAHMNMFRPMVIGDSVYSLVLDSAVSLLL